jgi:hypothetical protein
MHGMNKVDRAITRLASRLTVRVPTVLEVYSLKSQKEQVMIQSQNRESSGNRRKFGASLERSPRRRVR